MNSHKLMVHKVMTALLWVSAFIPMAGMAQPMAKKSLFLIAESHQGRKYGYMDATGQVIIQPVFAAARDFSEGLAAVRIKGTYGYIDTTGQMVIAPRFDFATEFTGGVALVYQHGEPFYIRPTGEKAFEFPYTYTEGFAGDLAKVYTLSAKWGMIDRSGALIVDTAYSFIGPFVDGCAVVHKENFRTLPRNGEGRREYYDVGLIDTSGALIIPLGKFRDIKPGSEGCFRVVLHADHADTLSGMEAKTGFADRNGNLLLLMNNDRGIYISGDLHCGLAKVSIPKKEPLIKNSLFDYYDYFPGYMSLNGELVMKDDHVVRGRDFGNNRAFVMHENGAYSIINTKGEYIAHNICTDILGNGFTDGVAFVKRHGLWGLIDTNVHFIFEPVFADICKPGLRDGLFRFRYLAVNYDTGDRFWFEGVGTKEGKILVDGTFEHVNLRESGSGMILLSSSEGWSYMNAEGKVIWKETSPMYLETWLPLNLDYKSEGYYHARPLPGVYGKDTIYDGGNLPYTLTGEKRKEYPEDSLSFVVKENHPHNPDRISRYAVLVNRMNSPVLVSSWDQQLEVLLQALDVDGVWRNIESLNPSVFYTRHFKAPLLPNYYWQLPVPEFAGEFHTRLRLSIMGIEYPDKGKKAHPFTLYSNEWEGSVNPAQFWRKRPNDMGWEWEEASTPW